MLKVAFVLRSTEITHGSFGLFQFISEIPAGYFIWQIPIRVAATWAHNQFPHRSTQACMVFVVKCGAVCDQVAVDGTASGPALLPGFVANVAPPGFQETAKVTLLYQ